MCPQPTGRMEDPTLDHMKSEAKGVLGEAVALANQISRTPDPMSPLVDYAVDKVAAGFGAAVTESLLGVRRPGSQVGRVWIQRQRAIARRAQQEAQKKQAVALAIRLEGAVKGLPDSAGRRFKRSMLNELAEARKVLRAATVVRRIAVVAERISDYEPPSPLIEGPALEYTQLKDLEQGLRDTIVDVLSRLSGNWWEERIPEDVRLNAERRLQANASPWPWHALKAEHPVSFIDFPDYMKIITRKDNWREAFLAIFKDLESVRTKLRELEPIRNNIAHSRDLTVLQKEKLRLYSLELLTAMHRKG